MVSCNDSSANTEKWENVSAICKYFYILFVLLLPLSFSVPKTETMMQLFLTTAINKVCVWRRSVWLTLCFFSIFLLENLVLVNSEKFGRARTCSERQK